MISARRHLEYDILSTKYMSTGVRALSQAKRDDLPFYPDLVATIYCFGSKLIRRGHFPSQLHAKVHIRTHRSVTHSLLSPTRYISNNGSGERCYIRAGAAADTETSIVVHVGSLAWTTRIFAFLPNDVRDKLAP